MDARSAPSAALPATGSSRGCHAAGAVSAPRRTRGGGGGLWVARARVRAEGAPVGVWGGVGCSGALTRAHGDARRDLLRMR